MDGVWVSEEIKKAVEMGYTNIRMSEVWHYDNFTVYDPNTRKGGLFSNYIDAFMQIKQESSGYPAHVKSDEDREKYIADYFAHEGIKLDPSKITKNSGLRAIAKRICNVLWGKLAERENLKKTVFVKTTDELLKYFRDSEIEVQDLIVHNEHSIELHYTQAAGFVDQNLNTNIVLASFTTALARLKLYSVLEKVGDRALYMDTDSIVFKTDPSHEHNDPQTGDYLGDLTNEIDPTNEEYIQSWLCGGPKNYSFKTSGNK